MPQVIAVEFDQIEGIEKHVRVMVRVSDAVEIRHSVVTTPPRHRRCRTGRATLARLHAEPPSYDWFISIAVFWHVEDPTAAALIREFGKLLKPGGYVLIEGWNSATPEKMREMSTHHRLFSSYPTYVLNLDLLQKTLEPDSCKTGGRLRLWQDHPFLSAPRIAAVIGRIERESALRLRRG
jgi:SAM-dependent methyltransferase